jgi:amidase
MAELDALSKAYREQFTPPLSSDFIYTFPANLAGVPTLTLPSGFTTDGRPQALQLIGRRLSEATLCRIGHAFERATDWHARHPAV